ncbi:YcnI family protein [Jeongeupia sp. USM3]|uniref:YcnI family copper-binding membrane protein n=1 Tax=Jeongeupia sp. USM3 TaxID=1906741 RepID=UPI00089DEA3F|nr:YcnI family protein [Jeongeupia sp. USM3]AOY00997.1 hypothetical protein BJP62_11425 [Jeongeupia sp. USM3]
MIRSAVVLALLAGSAQAHVMLQQKYAPAGSDYKAVFQVAHGCDGAATTGLRVIVPAGVTMAKPAARAGWKLDIETAADQRVTAVRWHGGTLPDTQFDEFAMLLSLPAEAGKLYFKVEQWCGKRKIGWTGIPVAGQAEPEHPAPVLELAPAAGSGHHHH